VSKPTPWLVHRKKLARLRKRRAQYAWKRAGRRWANGEPFPDDVTPIFGCFRKAPGK
jgi:hypothetical protein